MKGTRERLARQPAKPAVKSYIMLTMLPAEATEFPGQQGLPLGRALWQSGLEEPERLIRVKEETLLWPEQSRASRRDRGRRVR